MNNTNDNELHHTDTLKINKNIDKKINNSCFQNNFYNEKIYIKNLNIYENKFLNEKTNNSKSEEKRYSFNSLEISSDTTLNINSSYENINQLTNYNYISDEELRKKTKKFLFRECGKHNSETNLKKVNPHENDGARKSLSSDLLINLLGNKNQKNKISQKKIADRDTLKSFQSLNNNKSNKFRISVVKGNNILKILNRSIGRRKESFNNLENKSLNKIRKAKEKNEMFMISNNIKRNNQNLNNPKLFYTGLFNNIIEKRKKLTEKSKTISSKIKNKKSKSPRKRK